MARRSVVVLVVLGSQSKGNEFDSHLSFAVMSVSISFYATCSSVPGCKIGTWLWLGLQKKGSNIMCPTDRTEPVWSKLDFGCQYHICDTVSDSASA